MIAQPMRCVKLTLPPRVRDMWLLITMRLSIMSFAGMVRTLVAVGTVSDSSMFAARVFGMPRSAVTVSSSVDSSAEEGTTFGAWAGIGCAAAGFAVVRATGGAPMTGTGAVTGCAVGAVPSGTGTSPLTGLYSSRIGHQALSTEFLSTLNCSYSSSTSHSLAPNSPSLETPTPVTWLDTPYRPLS